MNYEEEIQKVDIEINCLKEEMFVLQTKMYVSKKDSDLSNEFSKSLILLRSSLAKKMYRKKCLEKEMLEDNKAKGRGK